MNEPARRGRPPTKHLEQEHHFRTSDEPAAAVATPAAAESDQGSTVEASPLPERVDVLPESIEEITGGSGDSSEPEFKPGDTVVLDIPEESPAEQKIEELVEAANLNGWHNIETEVVLELPPKNGTAVYVSDKPSGQGTLVVWKKTRACANATRRWEATGVWIDFVSGIPIAFKPKYWKERYVS